VRRHAILLTLLAADLAVTLLAIFLHLRFRPPVLQAFADYNTELPQTAAIALSGWFLPGAIAASTLLAAVAIVAPLKRSARATLAGIGTLLVSFAVIFAVWAAFAPLFQPA
jgi:ABC-type Na+ efflux pump permease subunit